MRVKRIAWLGVLLSVAARAGGPAPGTICRLFAEFNDPDHAYKTVRAGFRGQIYVQSDGRTLCLQDRTAVADSIAKKSTVCSEEFKTFNQIGGMDPYTPDVYVETWQHYLWPYFHKIKIDRPWSDSEVVSAGSGPYTFKSSGPACKKISSGAIAYAAGRLALKAKGPTSDPNTSTFPREEITNAATKARFEKLPVIDHVERAYSPETIAAGMSLVDPPNGIAITETLEKRYGSQPSYTPAQIGEATRLVAGSTQSRGAQAK